MAITVLASPNNLNWTHFQIVEDLGGEDAYNHYYARLPQIVNFRQIGSEYALPATTVITISPSNCQIRKGANKTSALLKHEQLHYDIGINCSRVLATDLKALRASSAAELQTAINDAFALHEANGEAISAANDAATDHSRNTAAQKAWEKMMSKCKGDLLATNINGLNL